MNKNRYKLLEEELRILKYYPKLNKNKVVVAHNLNNIDLHFHFLDATTKKDGPSAGLSIAVALISLLEDKAVSEDVAFTGELSLNGSVLKIGGLKEKLIGAYNENIKQVYIPATNALDLEEVPKEVKDNMEIILVNSFKEVYTKIIK